jgi:hypothetical protein
MEGDFNGGCFEHALQQFLAGPGADAVGNAVAGGLAVSNSIGGGRRVGRRRLFC